MKQDTQHLDFLISQYVDGCLDGASKKSVEQQLLTDPSARKLYTEHREVQDLLDDWGNRIPLIDWDEFDQKLATRLEHETVGSERQTFFRRWGRPIAAAAALFIAASVGYSWHAFWGSAAPVQPPQQVAVVKPAPRTFVAVADQPQASQPWRSRFVVDEQGARATAARPVDAAAVAVSAPGDAAAVESLKDTVRIGLLNVNDIARPASSSTGSVAVDILPEPRKDREADAPLESIYP
jgi:hypothetical protein